LDDFREKYAFKNARVLNLIEFRSKFLNHN